MPIGGASVGEGLRLQPAQQACLCLPSTTLKTHLSLITAKKCQLAGCLRICTAWQYTSGWSSFIRNGWVAYCGAGSQSTAGPTTQPGGSNFNQWNEHEHPCEGSSTMSEDVSTCRLVSHLHCLPHAGVGAVLQARPAHQGVGGGLGGRPGVDARGKTLWAEVAFSSSGWRGITDCFIVHRHHITLTKAQQSVPNFLLPISRFPWPPSPKRNLKGSIFG